MTILPPPDGYDVDFADPQRQYVQATYWATGFMCALGLLCLSQRFYVKFVLQKRFQIEDGRFLESNVGGHGLLGLVSASFAVYAN